jgi:hypothetical protein
LSVRASLVRTRDELYSAACLGFDTSQILPLSPDNQSNKV